MAITRSLATVLALGLSFHIQHVASQFPPQPKGITVLKSKFHENVTISFKEPGICETTPGVKSYSGYVHLPPGLLNDGIGGDTQDYPINTFFWFFESRKDPLHAPLAIWLNGGPGASSMMGLLEENGPCLINPNLTASSNPWSWNNEVNMLYLDQPVQVGFSYDTATNCTVTAVSDSSDGGDDSEDDPGYRITPHDFGDGPPPPDSINATHRVGTFSSQEAGHTANSTRVAAHALWHFAQTWFGEFPGYRPADDRVSLWAESYGGHYGPGFFRFFEEQNQKIADGTGHERDAHPIHLDTLGIVNGLMDVVVQTEGWIEFPYNNTYGIELFNQSVRDGLMHEWRRPGGCRERYLACREALRERDGDVYLPHLAAATGGGSGRESKHNVTEACSRLEEDCEGQILGPFFAQGRGFYDITHPKADPFPAPYMYGYLNEASTLSALGVPVNFTAESEVVHDSFLATYDIAVGGFLEAIGYLLDRGVKVHMMYGDRDYGCNWLGGEKASLAVPWDRADRFAEAGYAPLVVAGGGVAGMTRQVGRYSFTRVFQAGHEVPSYQPEAAYEIFRRATLGLDVPTGLAVAGDQYITEGPRSTWHMKNEPPEMPKSRCYILKPATCVPEVWAKFAAGKAVVRNYFVEDDDDKVEESGPLDGASDQKPLVPYAQQ